MPGPFNRARGLFRRLGRRAPPVPAVAVPTTQLGTTWERERTGERAYRHVQYIKPIAYRDENGHFQRIASSFVDSQFPNTQHMVTAAPFWVSVTEDGIIRYHATRNPSIWLEIGDPVYYSGGELRRYYLRNPTRTDNRLQWDTPHLQMRYYHGGHFGKLGMLFKTNAYQSIDNREFAFPVTYHGCTREGRNILVAGKPRMRLRPFRAYDYDNPDQVTHVDHEWRTVGGQEYVVVALPLVMDSWSKPVLDPSVEIQPDADAGKDAQIYSTQPDTNISTGASITIDGNSINKAVLQFDVSSIPATATVTAVELQIVVTNAGDPCTLYRILPANDWVEAEVTWNSAKSGTSWAGAAGCSTAGTDHDATGAIAEYPAAGKLTVDTHQITFTSDGIADVQGWVDGTYTNNGLLFHMTGGTDGAIMSSSDHGTEANRPKLTVEYTVPAGNGNGADDGPPLFRRMRH